MNDFLEHYTVKNFSEDYFHSVLSECKSLKYFSL